jgi:mRNA export factor
MAVVGTAGRGIIIYTLEQTPKEYKRDTSPLKYQHRCISIFRDKKAQPTGKENLVTLFLEYAVLV